MTAQNAELNRARQAIANAMSRDRARLFNLLNKWRNAPANDQTPRESFAKALAESLDRREQRKSQLPSPTINPDLPIADHAQEIIDAIRNHPVVVIAGETGSGKTTQIPKLALLAGRGETGQIACTQPRRLAARSVAGRVAEELESPLGQTVGFQVRSQDIVSERTVIKFMTDGILLAEIQSDKWLSRYDTIIIDEAHERSLNIDFLLGYMQLLLKKRRDLKVIVTSATIDTERFSRHFGDAPIIHVEGRTYPVEVRYRPTENQDGEPIGVLESLVSAMEELTRADPHGDVLVFLPGEREIREAHQVLEKKRFRHTEVLPLYARLSAKDQDRIFNPNPQRRIVLATNVAETSITVPRIRYVIDPGYARIKRYSPRAKIDRLQIEPISQASANQRMGRCGRVSEGICIRLYSQADFDQRPEFTDPEIKRAALAGVMLRMLSLGLGEIDRFPFLEMPDSRAVTDGWQELVELNAIDGQRKLTEIGRTMAQWPVDVKLARMLTASKPLGVTRELLIIASFLGVQDPRERPADQRQAADQAHAEFADPRSEFVGILNLWRAYEDAHQELSSSKLRQWCQKHFVGFLRMREWRDLHRQLKIQMDALQWPLNDPTPQDLDAQHYAQLHKALITGMPTQVGHRNDKGGYDGPRGRKYLIFPGSSLAKKPPPWLLSAQILETEKVWGLTNAAIEPAWIMDAVPHLLARKQFNPHWSRAQGRVLGSEQISLFGLILAPHKPVHYGALFPQESRAIFVRDALLPFEINSRSGFIEHNRKVLETARQEEAKQRRTGLVVDEDWMARWYLDRLPPDVHNVHALDHWTRKQSPQQRAALQWSLTDLLIADPANAERFPPYWPLGDVRLGVRYHFEPGAVDDGMTIKVPLHLLNAMDTSRLSWLAPGLVEGKAAALIKTLPKALRRHVVPAPDFAKAFAQAYSTWNQGLPPSADSISGALAKFLSKITGQAMATTDFDESALEPNWQANLQLTDTKGQRVLDQSRDLDALKAQHGEQAAQAFAAQATKNLQLTGLTEFPADALPRQVKAAGGVPGYVALRDDGEQVSVQVLADPDLALQTHRVGVARLLQMALKDAIKQARKQLPIQPKAALQYTAIENKDISQLRVDLVQGALMDLLDAADLDIRDAQTFQSTLAQLSRNVFREAMQRWQLSIDVLAGLAQVRQALDSNLMGWAAGNLDDLRRHLRTLAAPGFLSRTPVAQLKEYPRYLKAMNLRAQRAKDNPQRDQQRLLDLKPFVDALAKADLNDPAWQDFAWDVEELRVQTFAQELGTQRAVSNKKLAHKLAALLT